MHRHHPIIRFKNIKQGLSKSQKSLVPKSNSFFQMLNTNQNIPLESVLFLLDLCWICFECCTFEQKTETTRLKKNWQKYCSSNYGLINFIFSFCKKQKYFEILTCGPIKCILFLVSYSYSFLGDIHYLVFWVTRKI